MTTTEKKRLSYAFNAPSYAKAIRYMRERGYEINMNWPPNGEGRSYWKRKDTAEKPDAFISSLNPDQRYTATLTAIANGQYRVCDFDVSGTVVE